MDERVRWGTNKVILGVGLELVISCEEQIFLGPFFPVSIHTKLHALHKTSPAVKCLHVKAAGKQDSCERETGWRQERLLASPRLIKSNSADHLFAQTTTLINYVQLSRSFCNILQRACRKTFLQTVHGRWDKMSLSHSSVQLWSGLLTHVHKSICVKRKTGLILAEPHRCGHEKLIFFGCQLESWSWYW